MTAAGNRKKKETGIESSASQRKHQKEVIQDDYERDQREISKGA